MLRCSCTATVATVLPQRPWSGWERQVLTVFSSFLLLNIRLPPMRAWEVGALRRGAVEGAFYDAHREPRRAVHRDITSISPCNPRAMPYAPTHGDVLDKGTPLPRRGLIARSPAPMACGSCGVSGAGWKWGYLDRLRVSRPI